MREILLLMIGFGLGMWVAIFCSVGPRLWGVVSQRRFARLEKLLREKRGA